MNPTSSCIQRLKARRLAYSASMSSTSSYSMCAAWAGKISALSMPCSSIRASRRSRLPYASDWLRSRAMNASRSSSSRPFNGFKRFSSKPGTMPSSGLLFRPPDPRCQRLSLPDDALAAAEASPSILSSSAFENVICLFCADQNFEGLPLKSWIHLPLGAWTWRTARSAFALVLIFGST